MKIVKANNNSPVRLREQPNGKVIASIPQGAQAEVLQVYGDWSEITVNGTTGWMMSKFLVDGTETTSKPNLSELKAKLKEILQILDELED